MSSNILRHILKINNLQRDYDTLILHWQFVFLSTETSNHNLKIKRYNYNVRLNSI